jgi:rhodanese-related sulfurtransferase
MRLPGIPAFLSAFVLSAALLLAQSVMAIEPGPITPEEANTLIQQKKELLILDVRNPNEFVVAHYPNALNIPVNELEARFSEVPAGKPVLVHCALGKRGERGYQILKEKRPEIQELYFIKGQTIFP